MIPRASIVAWRSVAPWLADSQVEQDLVLSRVLGQEDQWGFVNSVLKEIKLSFEVSIVLKQTDVHWVEEELLRMREEVFLGVLKRVMVEIEGEALKEAKFCEKCGLVLVRNGRERRDSNPLLKLRLLKLNGEWDVYWQQRRKEFVQHAA